MTIFGDPDFIKQDGMFIRTNTTEPYVFPNPNQSASGIAFDTGEIYANVTFKVPQDINLTTGVLDLAFDDNDESNFRRNVFSGQYSVLTVANKFTKGLFTQQLNMARYDNSHYYEPVQGTAAADTSENYAPALHPISKELPQPSNESVIPPGTPTYYDF